jgi:tetratricopeptide (TPR) repeat protein
MLDNYKQAIEDYNRTIELCLEAKKFNDSLPGYATHLNVKTLTNAYILRGSLYNKLQNTNQETKEFSRAIDLNPKDAHAYYFREIFYYEHGSNKKAIQDLKVAARLDHQEAQDILMKEGIDW